MQKLREQIVRKQEVVRKGNEMNWVLWELKEKVKRKRVLYKWELNLNESKRE